MVNAPKWIEDLYGRTFTFGDLLTLVGFLGSIIAAIVSWRKSCAAKKSETKAKEYAENTNRAYLAIIEYFEAITPDIKRAKHQKEQENEKKRLMGKIFGMILEAAMRASHQEDNSYITTKEIAETLDLDIPRAKNLLYELAHVDKPYKRIHVLANHSFDQDNCKWTI